MSSAWPEFEHMLLQDEYEEIRQSRRVGDPDGTQLVQEGSGDRPPEAPEPGRAGSSSPSSHPAAG
jgi:hypothetical protein